MGEKCYFSTNELGYLNEPVMIGNTRLEDARVMNIIHEIERFDYTNRSTITIEGDLYPWCLGNNTGRVCGSFQWNVEKVIFSGPMTIVFWNDKSKTKVRLAADWDGRYDDRSEAIRWAMAKKFFGSRSQLEKRLAMRRNFSPFWTDSAAVYMMLMMLFDSNPKELDKYVTAAVEMAEDYRDQK